MASQLPEDVGVSVIETQGVRWLRAYGGLPHPNILAGFLAISIVVLITLLFLSKIKKEKIILSLSLLVITAGLFFTFSKSAVLALVIALIFLSIFIFFGQEKQIKLKFAQIILAMLFVVASLSMLYQAPLVSRLKAQDRLEQYSSGQRVNYLQQAQNLIQVNWLKGVGLGNYTLAVYNAATEKEEARFYQPVHNVFLLAAVETGLLGFVFFMLLLILVFREIWYFKIDEQSQLLLVLRKFKIANIFNFYQRRLYWFLGYTAIFIMLLVIMVFDHYFWTLYFGIILWWLMFGLWLKQVSLVK